MKPIVLALLLISFGLAAAQTPAASPGGNGFTFGTVAAAGPMANYASYASRAASPGNFSVAWSNAGTAAPVCLFEVGGSSDNVHFYSLSGVQSCANLTFSGTTTKYSNQVTGIANMQFLLAGQQIQGPNIAAYSYIQSLSSNSLSLTTNATDSGTVTLTVPAGYGMLHFLGKPVQFLRINILAYTAGDASTAITFTLSPGVS